MHSIFLALQSLRTQLAQALPAIPGLRHFDVSFPLNDAFDPLGGWVCSDAILSFTGNSAAAMKNLPRSEASPSLILWLRPRGFARP